MLKIIHFDSSKGKVDFYGQILFVLFLFVIPLLIFISLKQGGITGYVTLSFDAGEFYTNHTLDSILNLKIEKNEFLPAQTLVKAEIDGKESILTLEQLIYDSGVNITKQWGNFSVKKKKNVEGEGEGYQIEDGGTISLNSSAFHLQILDEGKYPLTISMEYNGTLILKENKKISIVKCIQNLEQHNASCQTDDTIITYYKDKNNCYEKTSLGSDKVPANETSSCDFCTPLWQEVNTSCNPNDTIESYFIDTNSCYEKTNLASDLIGRPANKTFSCDFCQPEWKAYNTSCQKGDTIINYFLDTNNCFAITNLTSDLLGKPDNKTYSCDYCKPNWTAVNTSCLKGDFLVTWYKDLNLCYELTGVNSDLFGKPANITHKFECDYEGNNILGDVSDVNTTLTRLAFYISKSANLSRYISDRHEILLKDGDIEIVEFNFNFSAFRFKLYDLIIKKQTANATRGFIVMNGLYLSLQNETKTFYISRLTNGASICVKDEENANAESITSSCNGTNEVLVKCHGITSNYICELNRTSNRYKISGLKHSAVIEQEAFCGDGSCNVDESCSSCSIDCGECPAPQSLGETRVAVGTPSRGCLPKWECSEWSACINGKQSRQCVNTKKYCPVEINKPAEEQECTSAEAENEIQAKEKAQEENITEVSTKKEVRIAGGLIGNVISAIRILPIQGMISVILNIVSLLFAFISSIIFFRLIRRR